MGKSGGEAMIDTQTSTCNTISKTGQWPTAWTQSLVKTLQRKGNVQLYRTTEPLALSTILVRPFWSHLKQTPATSCRFWIWIIYNGSVSSKFMLNGTILILIYRIAGYFRVAKFSRFCKKKKTKKKTWIFFTDFNFRSRQCLRKLTPIKFLENRVVGLTAGSLKRAVIIINLLVGRFRSLIADTVGW